MNKVQPALEQTKSVMGVGHDSSVQGGRQAATEDRVRDSPKHEGGFAKEVH